MKIAINKASKETSKETSKKQHVINYQKSKLKRIKKIMRILKRFMKSLFKYIDSRSSVHVYMRERKYLRNCLHCWRIIRRPDAACSRSSRPEIGSSPTGQPRLPGGRRGKPCPQAYPAFLDRMETLPI